MFLRRSRLRTLFLCMVLEFGLLAGIPMRPDDIARLMRWLAGPRAEQADPDDAAKGDGGLPRWAGDTIGPMRTLLRTVIGLAATAFAACYESPVPLDPTPQADLDQGVIGAWRCLPPEPGPTDEPANLTVTRGRDRVYDVVFDADDDRYEAYASVVKGRHVVNVRDLSDTKGRPWVFMQYALLRPDILEIRIADDDALEGVEATPGALRKHMEALAGEPRLFTGYCVCVRQKKAEPK